MDLRAPIALTVVAFGLAGCATPQARHDTTEDVTEADGAGAVTESPAFRTVAAGRYHT